MATIKRGLGRGLDVLLSSSQLTEPVNTAGQLRHLPIELMQRGKYQPRRDMRPEALQDLAESIKNQGVIQPIVVRKLAKGNYEIVAGERRWRAAQLAGLTEIPALIREIPDEAAMAIALIENIQRENLNPLEEAMALQRLLDEFGMTHQKVAEAVGKSRTTVTNLLRLLSLSSEVKTLLEEGALEMGHARTLLTLPANAQIEVARNIIANDLSVREVEKLVNRLQTPSPKKQTKNHIPPDVHRLEQNISDTLGAAVTLQHNTNGKGKLVIQYNSLDELDGILARIGIEP